MLLTHRKIIVVSKILMIVNSRFQVMLNLKPSMKPIVQRAEVGINFLLII